MKTFKLLLTLGRYAPWYFSAYFFLFFYCCSVPLPAQIVYWDFTEGSLTGQSSDSYVNPGNAYTGPGVATTGFPDAACSNGEPWSVRGWYNTSNIFQAISRGDYVAFSLSVDPGESFHITGISFSSNRSTNSEGDDRGPRTWAVYSSYDNYSNILFSGRNAMGETGTSASCGFHSDGVDIPLRGGESVTFRIYAYGETATEISTMRIDDFTVEGTVLPITLSSFTARDEGGKVQLSWQTHYEESNDYMVVERSAEGYYFREIGRISGAGTTSLQQDYFFTDEAPLPGRNFYRLRQVDFDGTEEIHRVVSVYIRSAGGPILIFPTLAHHYLSVRFPQAPDYDGHLYIYNTFGRVIQHVNVPQGALQQQFDISQLHPGTYLIRYKAGRVVQLLGRFVKQ